MITNTTRTLLTGLAFTFAVGASVPARAADDATKLAEALIALRSEVEALHDELDTDKRQHKDRMRSLAQRRMELEGEVQRKELEMKKLLQAVERSREDEARASSQANALRPIVAKMIDELEAHVDASLPFKREERLVELTEIDKKLASGASSAPRALNQLWTYIEDELRLSRENGMFSQVVTIDGNEQLAEVVRLGMVMLFFETKDARRGFAVRDEGAWSYQQVDGLAAKHIEALFDAFEKQVRTGYFEVPNALQGGVR